MPPKFSNQEGTLIFRDEKGQETRLNGFVLDSVEMPLSADSELKTEVWLVGKNSEFSAALTLDSGISLLTMARLFGVPVEVLPKALMCSVIGYEQARSHRKKRINKKWLKRYGYKPVYGPENNFMYNRTLYVGPDSYKKIHKLFGVKNDCMEVESAVVTRNGRD